MLALLAITILTACEPVVDSVDKIPVNDLSTKAAPTFPENLVLTMTANGPKSMAHEVAHHARKSLSIVEERLSHRQWLHIAGSYAIEAIHANDPASTCILIVDTRTPIPIKIRVHRADPTTGKPEHTPATTATDKFCPIARQVALTLTQLPPSG